MALSPTPRQAEFLRFVRGYQLAKGKSPTFAEIANGLGLAGRHCAHKVFVALEERGLACSVAGKARSIELLVPVQVPLGHDGAPLYFVSIGEAL